MYSCEFCGSGFVVSQKLDDHHKICKLFVTLTFRNKTVRVQQEEYRGSDAFLCHCSHHASVRAFRSRRAIQDHVRDTDGEWLKSTNDRAVLSASQPSSQQTSKPSPSHNDTGHVTNVNEVATVVPISENNDDYPAPDASQGTSIKSNLIEDDILRPFNLRVQPVIRVVICLECECGYAPNRLNAHIQTHLPTAHCPLTQEDISLLKQKYKLADVLVPPKAIVPQLSGLRLFSNYIRCPFEGCSRIYAEGSLRGHYSRDHRLELARNYKLPRISAQQINRGNCKTLFEVIPCTYQKALSAADAILSSLQQQREEQLKKLEPSTSDARMVSPFLLKTHWPEHVKGFKYDELSNLVSMPTVRDPLAKLKTAMSLLYDKGYTAISKLDILVLQILRTDHPQQTGIGNVPLKEHYNESTLENYQGTAVKLLSMLLRPKTEYRFELAQTIRNDLDSLQKALLAKDSDYPKMASLCRHILFRIWTREWEPTRTNTIGDPTMCFLALSMHTSDKGFKPPGSVTPPISHLLHTLRLVFAIAIHHESSQPNVSQMEACNMFAKWFREKEISTFNSLKTLSHLASTYAGLENAIPRTFWTDREEYKEMLYNGSKITFGQIHTTFVDIQRNAIELWEQKVLMGTGLYIKTGHIADDISDTRVGYSMLSDRRNQCFADRDLLLKTILHQETLSKRFLLSGFDDRGLPIWNVTALQRWLLDLAHFEEKLLLSVQMKSGSPARGTEITCLQYRNTPYRRRSLYAFGGHIAVFGQYTKTGSHTGYDKVIPHSLDAVTSDLVIQLLAIARPFAELAVLICYPHNIEMQGHYHNSLFVNNKKLFTTPQLTEALRDYTRKNMQYSAGVNDWRHISTAFRRKICPGMEELEDEDEDESVEAAQSGHSRNTENRVYGISPDRLAGVGEDILPLFLDVSTDWQVANQIVPGGHGLSYMEARAENFQQLVAQGRIKSTFLAPVGSLSPILKKIQHLLDIKLEGHSNALFDKFKSFLMQMFPHGNAVPTGQMAQNDPSSIIPQTPVRDPQSQQNPDDMDIYGDVPQDLHDIHSTYVPPYSDKEMQSPSGDGVGSDNSIHLSDNRSISPMNLISQPSSPVASLQGGLPVQRPIMFRNQEEEDQSQSLATNLTDTNHFPVSQQSPPTLVSLEAQENTAAARPQRPLPRRNTFLFATAFTSAQPPPRLDLRKPQVSSKTMTAHAPKPALHPKEPLSSKQQSVQVSISNTAFSKHALERLQQLTHKQDAGWRSPQQLMAIQHVAASQSDILLIMATGSGKTLVTLIPTLLDGTVTVYILPLNSLIDDYKIRLDRMNIPYDHCHSKNKVLRKDVQVILVSVDFAITRAFTHAISVLHAQHEVGRLVFDEAHMAFSGASYRTVFSKLPRLRVLPVPLILLSGTIAPPSTPHICSLYRLHPQHTVILRAQTNRPEIWYRILPKQDNTKKATEFFDRKIVQQRIENYTEQDRCLVFVPSKNIGRALAKHLDCDFYYGGRDGEDDREALYRKWIRGEKKILVATNALGAGNDYPHVRDVVHFGTPKEMINFVQEASRGGRDGNPACSSVIPIAAGDKPPPLDPDHLGIAAMYQYLWHHSKQCLRHCITTFCDGVGVFCGDSPSNRMCGLCELELQLGRDPPKSSTSISLPQWPSPSPSVTLPAKRKAIPNPFMEMADAAKRHWLEADAKTANYVRSFQMGLGLVEHCCAYCFGLGFDLNTCHLEYRCQHLKPHFEEFNDFRDHIDYDADIHPPTCWKCHIPQLGDKLHPTFDKSSGCQFKNKIISIAFAVFMDPLKRTPAQKHFGAVWSDVTSFSKWMSLAPPNGEQVNIARLFCWYMKVFRDV